MKEREREREREKEKRALNRVKEGLAKTNGRQHKRSEDDERVTKTSEHMEPEVTSRGRGRPRGSGKS
jgi:hypothetical protein